MIVLQRSAVATREHSIGHAAAPRWWRRLLSTPVVLSGICVGFVAICLTVRGNANPFQDEGLYLFMGHRMIDSVINGVHVSEYPGTYFSGAPALYPVLGALADTIGGVSAARAVSTLFMVVTIIATYGIGNVLFGRAAGLIGAAAFALSGSVIFVANLATFDAMALCLMALGTWLTVHSATTNRLLWAPIIGAVLMLAFLTKYATGAYIPGIVAMGVLLAWPTLRWGAMRRGLVILAAVGSSVFFVLVFWAPDLRRGIISTTADRAPLSPAPPMQLFDFVAEWAGLWIILAALGALTQLRRRPVALIMLALAVLGPAQQIRIGEGTSLAKHVGFGLIFAGPLIGALLVSIHRRAAWLAVPATAAMLIAMFTAGTAHAGQFLTTWVDDRHIINQLREEIAISPDKNILGEEPSAQRYALRGEVRPNQWNDTFVLLYGGKTGMPAYQEAIDQTHFSTIYLTLNTPNGRSINEYLTNNETPYRLSAMVPFYRHGDQAGEYLVWTPSVLER